MANRRKTEDEKTKPFTLTLNVGQMKKIDALCEKFGFTRSGLVRASFNAILEQVEKYDFVVSKELFNSVFKAGQAEGDRRADKFKEDVVELFGEKREEGKVL